MSEIEENLNVVRTRICEACLRFGSHTSSVNLIAVSKTYSSEHLRDAVKAGQFVFGESRLQEAQIKIADLPADLEWHFIGKIQRNKLRKLLKCFRVIHSIDSSSLATTANDIAAELGLTPRIFLQVNVGGELSKGGFDLVTLRPELKRLLHLSHLEIIGLMCIPPPAVSAELSRSWFVQLRTLRNDLEAEFGVKLPCLSMGMSQDYEVAIEEGSTHVRIGSAIFGQRPYRVEGELG
jgi:pyridoxal phosphate enzyme (YggS family)